MRSKYSILRKDHHWALITVLAIILSACIKDIPEPTPVSYLNLYNASPELRSFDIYLNDSQINSSPFDFSKFSGYLNFTAGISNLKFNQYTTTTKLVETNVNLTADKPYTLFVINAGTGLDTWLLRDSSGLATAGRARLRFIQLCPDAGELDVVITGSTSSPLFAAKPYKSASEFVDLESKIYSLDLVNRADGTVLSTVSNINLESAKYYTIVARGFVSPPTGNNNKAALQLLTN